MDKTPEIDRINEMVDVIMRVARGDYSVLVKPSSDGNDKLDSLAIGINMMIEDIQDSNKEVDAKIHELESFKKIAVGRELKMIELKMRIKELEKRVK